MEKKIAYEMGKKSRKKMGKKIQEKIRKKMQKKKCKMGTQANVEKILKMKPRKKFGDEMQKNF